MRLAIIIAGEYREFVVAHKFWTFLKWPNVDIYFATWNTSITIPCDKTAVITTESISSESITNYLTVKDMEIAESPKDTLQNISQKMLNRWQAGINLMRRSDIKYDRVILIRPDLALDYDELEFKTFVESIPDDEFCLYGITGGALGVPFPLQTVKKVSDLMLMGIPDSFYKLLQLPSPLNGPFDVHLYLAENFISMKMKLKNMPIPRQCVVRSTSRGAVNPSFQECKLKSRDWWEQRNTRFFDMGENIYDPRMRPIDDREIRNLNSINLWDKMDYIVWPECYQSLAWKGPDSEEYFNQRSKDPKFAHHITYGRTDIDYCYNSLGFRVPSLGPKEFKDAGEYTKFLVGGCSVTEGIGLPEHHLWHSFLVEHLYNHSSQPIAKYNVGKGGISVASAIRYAYVSIQHYGLKPDLVYFCFPPVSRKELLLLDDRNRPIINPHLPSTTPTDKSPRSVIEMYEAIVRNYTHRQYYHDAFKELILFKWLCEAKSIPWFFNFWRNDFSPEMILENLNESHHDVIDCNIPVELKSHYIPVWQRERGEEAPFPQTIARDYMHSGPNTHFDLAKRIYSSLMENPVFLHAMDKWKNNGYN